MPFPESDREIYERNPLKEVICQFRFPTILQITAEIPTAFQNEIRKEYPIYTEQPPEISAPPEIASLIKSLPIPKGIQQPVHKFSNEDETRFISLNQGFLGFSDRDYRRWESFKDSVQAAEEAFRLVYEPAFYTRIGLRYRDVIDREELELSKNPWRDLLNSSLIGTLGADGFSEEEIGEVQSQILLRLQEVPGGVVRIQHGLNKLPDTQESVYLIDSDFYLDRQRSNPDHAFETLGKFNRLGGRLFRWAITPELRRALGPSSI